MSVDRSLYAHHATVLPVRELSTSRDFYRDRLGFEVGFEWQDPPTYAVLRAESTSIHLSEIETPREALAPTSMHPTLIYLFTHDVDALHAQVAASGVEISSPLQTFDYGMREFEVRDPDGHRLTFGQGVGDD